jgi:Domain of unknown function (DUF4430)
VKISNSIWAFSLILFGACGQKPAESPVQQATDTTKSATEASLVFVYNGDSTKAIGHIPVYSKSTVESMMIYSQDTLKTLMYKTKSFPSMGDYLVSVDAFEAKNNYYWYLTVNGKKSSEGMSSKAVASGDVVVWQLTNSKH